MKKLTTLIVLFFLAITAFAGNVSEQQALQKAQAFLKTTDRAALNVKAPTAVHKKAKKAQGDASSYYYVFNLENNQGFIIVSGDDRTEEILGYADSGSFDPNNIPENMQYLLDGYAEEIAWMDANNYKASETPRKVSNTVVAPLLTTKWNQGSPYYNLCPTLNGSRCVTGCVATAMAQIMYYHKWPENATTQLSGYTCSSGAKVEDLAAITFSWSSMTNTYTSTSSAASKTAVAQLMAYCGSAVKMNYRPSGSGASSSNVPGALSNNFGYASSAKYVSRAGYTIESWDELITNELVNNRPVYYSGSTSSSEGHAFVCDGRRADGMFHINWGWGGSCDGYYRLSLLDPTSQGIGGSSTGSKYSVRQGAVIGISKTYVTTPGVASPAVTAGKQSIKKATEYTRSSTSSNFPSITIATPYGYVQSSYATAKIGLALYKDGTLNKVLVNSTTTIYNPASYVIDPKEFTVQFGAGLADGTYQIVPVYNPSSQWVKTNLADNNYIEAVISGNKLSLKVYPQGDFTVTSTSFTNKNLIVNFTNNAEEYNGPIYLYKADGTLLCQETVAVPARSTDKINLYVSDQTFSMDEAFFLSTDYYLRDYFYTNLVTTNSNLSKSLDLLNANAEKTNVYGKTIRYSITLTNSGTGVYRHFLRTELYEKSDPSTVIAENKQLIDLPAGETETLQQEFTLTDEQMGKEYMIKSIHIDSERDIVLSTDYFVVGYGATAWDAAGNTITIPSGDEFVVPENVAAIDLRSVGTTNIVPNSNPNTIYLLESVPTSLKGKNVVNSLGRTGSLTLYDGYPYYIPEKIQTKKVYYKRTFTTEEAGTWTTMALPFAPNVVKNETDNTSLTWHTSESDTGKDLWIQELTSVSEQYLTFTNIAAFTEYRPYIISVPASLVGKTISFQKELSNIYVDLEPTPITHTVGQVTLYGTNGNTDASGKYIYSSEKFIKTGNSAGAKPYMEASAGIIVPPFRVYANIEGASYDALLINSSHTTGIATIVPDGKSDGKEVWYTIDGIRLNTAPTTKGIYILNGKKVVK